jgi:hypothetical protein
MYIYRQLHPSSGPSGPGWKDILSFVEREPETKRRMTERIRLNQK